MAPIASAGPYHVTSASASEIVLERNPHYGGSRVQNLGTIRWAPHGSPLAEDYVADAPATYTAPAEATEHINLTTGTQMLHLNTSRAPFNDVNTRRAAAFAVNRTALSALRNWQATDQFLSPLMPGAQNATIYPLDGSGTSTAQGLLGGATPNVRLCHASGPMTPVAELAEPQLESVGFQVTRIAEGFGAFITRISDPANCELALVGWNPDFLDPSAFLQPTFYGGSGIVAPIGGNFSFFNDVGFNAKLETAAAIPSDAARLARYGELDVELAQAAPAIALGHIRRRDVFSDRIGCKFLSQALFGYAVNRLCIEVAETAAPGETVSTGGEATQAAPLQTGVTVPSGGIGGTVTITQGQSSTTVPPGFALLEQQLDIAAPAQTPPRFLVFTFRLDSTLLSAAGLAVGDVAVYRNGSPIPDCTGAGLTSDPCVASRETLQPSLDGEIVVRSSEASIWEFGARYDPADAVDDLEAIASQATPLADKAEDALLKVESAVRKLAQSPPDRQGALGELEGAVGDLEAAIKDGLPADQGRSLQVELAGAARLVALEAQQEALDRDGHAGKLDEAARALADGDARWASGQMKDAVASYKDAVSKAEGA